MKTPKTKILMRVFNSLLITLVTGTLCFAADGKIVGKVTDKMTGEPLVGVTVGIESSKQGALTDVEGDYIILNVSPGTYRVQASMVGYKTTIKTNVQVSQDHTTTIDFQLEETVVQISESVIITAERPLVEKDLTSTRHFVSAEEISARPTTQLTNILSTLPGIDADASGQLTVRRGTLDQVAFMIDGIRARNPLDFQPYTNINISSIQELEIITGGFSAEYGEAQSGVFNIVTKDGGNKYEGYGEFRYTPPGLKHWGTALYDYSSPKFWENTHARHLQWWIDNPNQWVDPNGVYGNDPNCSWTPEQAYEDYINTHQPLTDYTDKASYQTEISFGGPAGIPDMYFFFSGKYKSAPPISGNSFLSRGEWLDGTVKLTYRLNEKIKLMASGFYSTEKTDNGMTELAFENGFENKYAIYDYSGYPTNRVDGQTIKLTNVLNSNTFYELQFSRVFRYRSQGTFPGDVDGWETGSPLYDNLRATFEDGSTVPGGYNNIIGLHTTGYYYRGTDKNTDLSFSGDLISQVMKQWQLKTGFDFTYYNLDRLQEGKAYSIIEKQTYNPYEGNAYITNKLEFEGLIMNIGLRFDFYNPNDYVYLNPFDPFDEIAAELEGREPNPLKEKTKITGQLSPRIGISHPISDNTVLHFSYGHFFQRAPFGDYGEGTGTSVEGQTVSGILNTYVINTADGRTVPYNLGNRKLKPQKNVQYELGIEHNFGGIVTTVTAFYKDYTNMIRTVQVFMDDGTSYLTTGNSNYSDAKGVEVALRRPLTGLWGGYLNFTWSTGITGRSGDPDVIASPASGVDTRVTDYTGDAINYDPSRLKFGFVFAVPNDFTFLYSLVSNLQVSLDYQVYFPHKQITSDNIVQGGKAFIRDAYKNADLRIRKEISVAGLNLAAFIEIHNLFNDKHTNMEIMNTSNASTEEIAAFVNSRYAIFPEYTPNGGTFPDVLSYQNLPRSMAIGFAVGF